MAAHAIRVSILNAGIYNRIKSRSKSRCVRATDERLAQILNERITTYDRLHIIQTTPTASARLQQRDDFVHELAISFQYSRPSLLNDLLSLHNLTQLEQISVERSLVY